MAAKRKVCIVITARPSYSRVRTVLTALQARDDVELQVVLAASALLDRFGGISNTIEADGFPVTAKVFSIVEGESLLTSAKSTGLGILELAGVFDQIKPDVVVSVADRYETLATAVAASYTNIPVAHLQGGEVTGSIDEKVRHAVTKLSDMHFACTQQAADYIKRLGEAPSAVHFTGCPSIDIADEVAKSGKRDFDPFKHYGGIGPTFSVKEPFLVVMQHPVTTQVEDAAHQTTETLEAVCDAQMNTFWFWPNIDAGADAVSKMIRVYREKGRLDNVHFFRSLRPEDFLRLMLQSSAIIGNSSVSVREGSYLGVPAVNVGKRQTYRERGHNVMDVGHERKAIATAIEKQVKHGHYAPDLTYGDGKAGARIAQLLATEPLRFEKVLSYVLET